MTDYAKWCTVLIVIKIKTYKINRAGLRGLTICLPAVWVKDVGLKPHQPLDLYRDDKDHLIIVAPTAKKHK